MMFEIISPDQVFFKGEVQMVTVPGTKGPFMILSHHAAIISTLSRGNIIYRINGKENYLAIESGFVEVHKNIITVCVEQLAVTKAKAK